MGFLRPEHLFGMTGMDPLSHAVFWTMSFNIGLYVLGSLFFERSTEEKSCSEEFVDVLADFPLHVRPVSQRAFIYLADKRTEIERLLCQYFPRDRAAEIAEQSLRTLGLNDKSQISVAELTELHHEIERVLAGSIGASAAYHALRTGITYTPVEERELSKLYAEILANLKLTPSELQEKIDYYREKELLLTDIAKELEEKIRERDREITERRRTAEKLIASEAKYKILTDSSLTGIYIHQEGKYVFVNERFAGMHGYASGELIGTEYTSLIHPEERENVRTRVDKRIHGEKIPQRYEVRMIKRDGQVIWCETIATIIQYEGKPAIMGNMIDITERKIAETALRESEEQYRSLVENIKIGVYRNTGGRHGWFMQANPAMLKIFGYDSFEEFRKIFVSDLYENPEERRVFLEEVLQSGFVKDREIRMHRKDGTPIWISVTASVQYDEKGSMKWIDGVLEDITERKHLEEQLRQAQKMEAIGTLAGGIAHDFNNILTAIIGYGNLLKEELRQDEHLSTYLNNILSSADRAAILVRSLLAFSRKQKLSIEPLDLNTVIVHLKPLLLRIIEESIELKIVLSPDTLTIMADAGQIEQVLMNLATNARDAMPAGGVLTIETEYAELTGEYLKMHPYIQPGEYALLSVSDTGTGMDETIKQRIFEPFFTTKEVGKGTGLGLAMIYGIIKQHDGYINVYTESEKGTTFKIYLPITQAETREPLPAVVETPVKSGTETILIAEDDREVRNLAKDLLQGQGYSIVEAVDGDDAVSKFMENRDRVRLLILDVIMPKMNGRQVYEVIRQLQPDIRAIFISGYTADVIHRRGIIEEGLDFVSKPLSPAEILRKIRDALDQNPPER
jgi:PAS domain S-box-containing protein